MVRTSTMIRVYICTLPVDLVQLDQYMEVLLHLPVIVVLYNVCTADTVRTSRSGAVIHLYVLP